MKKLNQTKKKITCKFEARENQNWTKPNGIGPNLYHSVCSPKLSHTPLRFGRKCQSVSIRWQLDAMFKRQAYSWDRGYDKEHRGDVISFLTRVYAIRWLDGVCPCPHLCVYMLRRRWVLSLWLCRGFLMSLWLLWQFQDPGWVIANDSGENSRRLYAVGAAILL